MKCELSSMKNEMKCRVCLYLSLGQRQQIWPVFEKSCCSLCCTHFLLGLVSGHHTLETGYGEYFNTPQYIVHMRICVYV